MILIENDSILSGDLKSTNNEDNESTRLDDLVDGVISSQKVTRNNNVGISKTPRINGSNHVQMFSQVKIYIYICYIFSSEFT